MVARIVRDDEAAGSNPVFPTSVGTSGKSLVPIFVSQKSVTSKTDMLNDIKVKVNETKSLFYKITYELLVFLKI